jgi:hypothetical protein
VRLLANLNRLTTLLHIFSKEDHIEGKVFRLSAIAFFLILALGMFLKDLFDNTVEYFKDKQPNPYKLFYKDQNGRFYYNAKGQRVNYVRNDDNMQPMVYHDDKLCYNLEFTEYCYTNSNNEIVNLDVSRIGREVDYGYYISNGNKKKYIPLSELDKDNPNIKQDYKLINNCYIKDGNRKIYLDPNITFHKTKHTYRYYFSKEGTRIDLENSIKNSSRFIWEEFE